MTDQTELLQIRLSAARTALEQHKKSGFHENPPCGGCHFWQGYIAALEDVISGEWHNATKAMGLRRLDEFD